MARWQENAVANGWSVILKVILIWHPVSSTVIGDLQRHREEDSTFRYVGPL